MNFVVFGKIFYLDREFLWSWQSLLDGWKVVVIARFQQIDDDHFRSHQKIMELEK
jgi:hypothetical protein